MNIVVVQFYTDNVLYGDFSRKINQRYCDKNNYEYFVETNSDKILSSIDGRSHTWYKPRLINEALKRFPNCDYVLFLDIDAIFINENRKIEEFIEDDTDILMTKDYGPSLVNAGVMLLRNSEYSRKFLKMWWDICEDYPQYKTGLWHDQTCIGLVHEKIDTSSFKIIEPSDFNSRDYNKDKFIFHAFSFGHTQYRTIDVIYREMFNIVPEEFTGKNIKAIVYHIYCYGDDYINLVEQQVKRLISSGVYDWCDVLEVSCIDTSGEFSGIDDAFSGLSKANIFKTRDNKFEYWGIKRVWEISQRYNGEVLYLHTKGVWNKFKDLESGVVSEWKIKSVSSWREAMEYFLVDNYKQCIEDITINGFDSCGFTCVDRWVWGNFWWADLAYIRHNAEPADGADRWYYEAWLHAYREFKCKEYYHCEWDLHYTYLPFEVYRDRGWLKGRKWKIVNATYGAFSEQKDEGWSDGEGIANMCVLDTIKKNIKDCDDNSLCLNLRVDNETFGNDPIFGVKKFLVILLNIDGVEYKIVGAEGRNLNINLK